MRMWGHRIVRETLSWVGRPRSGCRVQATKKARSQWAPLWLCKFRLEHPILGRAAEGSQMISFSKSRSRLDPRSWWGVPQLTSSEDGAGCRVIRASTKDKIIIKANSSRAFRKREASSWTARLSPYCTRQPRATRSCSRPLSYWGVHSRACTWHHLGRPLGQTELRFMACMIAWRHRSGGDQRQQLRDRQRRPRWWRVNGFSGSTILPIPALLTESVATRIGWVSISRRASDANCRAIRISKWALSQVPDRFDSCLMVNLLTGGAVSYDRRAAAGSRNVECRV